MYFVQIIPIFATQARKKRLPVMKKPNKRFFLSKRQANDKVLGRKNNPPAIGVVESLQESNRPLIAKLEAQLAAKK